MGRQTAKIDRRVYEIQRLLRQDPKTTVSRLAASVNLSVSRTRHLFKEQIGISLGGYIKALKMRTAKELLERTFLSVKEIVATLGRNDQSHFGRDFKKAYGLSPSKYRSTLPNTSSSRGSATPGYK